MYLCEVYSYVFSRIFILFFPFLDEGDVLSGTSASGVYHAGVLQGWRGEQWWNGRAFVLLATTLCVFAPLGCFKRIGMCFYNLQNCKIVRKHNPVL